LIGNAIGKNLPTGKVRGVFPHESLGIDLMGQGQSKTMIE
jgi:hypothetical protein